MGAFSPPGNRFSLQSKGRIKFGVAKVQRRLGALGPVTFGAILQRHATPVHDRHVMLAVAAIFRRVTAQASKTTCSKGEICWAHRSGPGSDRVSLKRANWAALAAPASTSIVSGGLSPADQAPDR